MKIQCMSVGCTYTSLGGVSAETFASFTSSVDHGMFPALLLRLMSRQSIPVVGFVAKIEEGLYPDLLLFFSSPCSLEE